MTKLRKTLFIDLYTERRVAIAGIIPNFSLRVEWDFYNPKVLTKGWIRTFIIQNFFGGSDIYSPNFFTKGWTRTFIIPNFLLGGGVGHRWLDPGPAQGLTWASPGFGPGQPRPAQVKFLVQILVKQNNSSNSGDGNDKGGRGLRARPPFLQ